MILRLRTHLMSQLLRFLLSYRWHGLCYLVFGRHSTSISVYIASKRGSLADPSPEESLVEEVERGSWFPSERPPSKKKFKCGFDS